MQVVVLAGGFGGAKFVRGLRAHLAAVQPAAGITVIANTADGIWLHGLRVCPDLDTIMYGLGDGLSAERGSGRAGDTFAVSAELAEYGAGPGWFGLGDRDIATHLIRRQLIDAGQPLSAITEALCTRWNPGVALLPMTDERAETHVVIDDPEAPGSADAPTRRAVHFQQWRVGMRAEPTAHAFPIIGIDQARPAPGVLAAIANADVILLAPGNPVVAIGPILAVPGMREAMRAAAAPVVGVSPIVGGSPVRGMADRCLAALGIPVSAAAVARHLGARRLAIPAGAPGPGVLDGWIIDERDSAELAGIEPTGIRARAVPSIMHDDEQAAALAGYTLDLATEISRQQPG